MKLGLKVLHVGAKRTFSDQTSKNFQYCMKLVKDRDFDNYLGGLVWPKNLRESYFAVKAFNVEIASVKDQTKGNKISGKMRFQWWKDALMRIEENSLDSNFDHPVINQLNRAVTLKHIKSIRWLQNSLETRQSEFYSTQWDSLKEMEDYVEGSHSSINYILLEILGINAAEIQALLSTNNSKNIDKFLNIIRKIEYSASHIGVASGITTLLRGFVYHLSLGSSVFPVESMNKVNLSHSQVMSVVSGCVPDAIAPSRLIQETFLDEQTQHDNKQKLCEVTHDVASQGFAHLERSLVLQSEILSDISSVTAVSQAERQALARIKDFYLALLPGIRASLYLETLRKSNFFPLDEQLIALEKQPFPLQYQYYVLMSLWRGKLCVSPMNK